MDWRLPAIRFEFVCKLALVGWEWYGVQDGVRESHHHKQYQNTTYSPCPYRPAKMEKRSCFLKIYQIINCGTETQFMTVKLFIIATKTSRNKRQAAEDMSWVHAKMCRKICSFAEWVALSGWRSLFLYILRSRQCEQNQPASSSSSFTIIKPICNLLNHQQQRQQHEWNAMKYSRYALNKSLEK